MGKNPLIVNWICLNVAGLVLLNAMLGLFIRWIHVTRDEEYRLICNEELNRFTERMDDSFFSINKLGNRFSLTSDMMQFRTVRALNPYNRFTVSKITEDLSRFVFTNELISDIFLYYKRGDFFISSNGYYGSEDKVFCADYYFNLSNYQLNKLLSEKYAQTYQILSDRSGVKQLYFFDTLPYTQTAEAQVNLVVKINMEKFYDYFKYDARQQSATVFIDSEGAGLAKEFSLPAGYNTVENGGAYRSKGHDYILYARDSQVMKGRYCAVYRAKSGFGAVSSTAEPMVFAAANLIFLAIGALIIWMIYPGLLNLEGVLSGASGKALERRLNLESMENSAGKLVEQKNGLEARAALRIKRLRQYDLLAYLQNPAADSRLLAEFQEGFQGAAKGLSYLLCLVRVTASKGRTPDGEEVYWCLQKSAKILSEGFSGKLNFEQYIGPGWFLLLLWEEKEAPRRDSKNLCAGVLRKFAGKYSLTLDYEFSEPFDSLDQIKNEYLKLKENTDSSNEINGKLPPDFKQALDSADALRLPALAQRLGVQCFQQPTGVEMKRLELANILAESYGILKGRGFFAGGEGLESVFDLKGFFTASEDSEIISRFAAFFGGLKGPSPVKRGDRFEAALEYINANLCNPSLDLNLIEEKFGINGPAFSKLFKKRMSVGYLCYIHTRRVEKAVKLLKQTDWTNLRIAQECGYINDIAMIRSFQKYLHTSPGRIRKENEDKSGEGPA